MTGSSGPASRRTSARSTHEYVRDAVAGLAEAGVLVIKRTRIRPSLTLRRLDELTMICV
jgi:hypothetical protein